MLNNKYIDRIAAVFSTGEERRECHRMAAPILAEMAKDQELLFEVIRRNLEAGNYCTDKKTTVIDFEIAENYLFSLRAHCFMPLPGREPLVSHQSIHHHGNLLLTTTAVFGEKYKSILFKKGIVRQADNSFSLRIEKIYDFRKGDMEFIDSYQPHIVFIPESLLITFVLWSPDKKYAFHKIKSHPVIRILKRPLKYALRMVGASNKLGVNNVEGFDYYPVNGKIYCLNERNEVPFPRPKENYIQNLFYILQEVGFHDMTFLDSLSEKIPAADFAIMQPWISKLRNKEPITDAFVPEHIGIEKVNLHFADIVACFTDQPETIS